MLSIVEMLAVNGRLSVDRIRLDGLRGGDRGHVPCHIEVNTDTHFVPSPLKH